jgi:hypothetical protein
VLLKPNSPFCSANASRIQFEDAVKFNRDFGHTKFLTLPETRAVRFALSIPVPSIALHAEAAAIAITLPSFLAVLGATLTSRLWLRPFELNISSVL